MDLPFDIRTEATHLRRVIRNALKRCRKKQEKQQAELEVARNWETERQVGDSLLAALHQIKKGSSEIALTNVHTGKAMQIPLDPRLSPEKNAKAYYRKSSKGKRAVSFIEEHLQRSKDEESLLKKLQNDFEAPAEENEQEDAAHLQARLDRIRGRLIENGYLPKAKDPKSRRSPEDPFRKIVLDGKWVVLIGRNDQQNDELTLHVAKPRDLWFHASGSPGSHVVLRRDSKDTQVPKDVVLRVASLAAWFSRQKHSAKVPVNYTEKRYVRKPRKSPPGLVAIEREKSVFVKPHNPHERE